MKDKNFSIWVHSVLIGIFKFADLGVGKNKALKVLSSSE